MVLCFVEFVDSNCALTAMEALQGKLYINNLWLFEIYLVMLLGLIFYPFVPLGDMEQGIEHFYGI